MGTLTRLTLATALLMLLAAGVMFASGSVFNGSADAPPAGLDVAQSQTAALVSSLQSRLSSGPQYPALFSQLGSAYLQYARETADPAYYTKAEGVFREALKGDQNEPSALIGMSSVALARHDFENALTWGQKAQGEQSSNANAAGAVGDALTELGRYDEAAVAFQQMVNLRPDLGSYARVAYSRELHGDLRGAIEAMKLAVAAGGPKGENAAWAHLQLGHLYFNRGQTDLAQQQYEASLAAFPGYLHALAAEGRIAAVQGDYDHAIDLYRQAVDRVPVLEYIIALGDVYGAAGQHDQAQKQFALVSVINDLYKANGVNTDQQVALFFADHDTRLDEALTQAQSVYQKQPGSVTAADALAWTLYKSGRYDEALGYSQQATRLGTRDANLLFHAGMINDKLGNYAQARNLLTRALDINPKFSLLYAGTARDTLSDAQALAQAR